MELSNLQNQIKKVMPLLCANLSAAHDEYMRGEMSAVAYRHILLRHGVANYVMKTDGLSAVDAYKACALLTIDVRSAIKDFGDDAVLTEWMETYRAAGFTKTNTIFDPPELAI